MLLEFETENYKSFKDRVKFSMIPAPKQKGLDYSILTETINNKIFKSLSTSVIYGANAAGKTNIIGALDVFRAIVMRGNIFNATGGFDGNVSHYMLELIPNNSLVVQKDVSFSIKFIQNELLFSYSLSIDLGTFCIQNYKRRITAENLTVNDRIVFNRSGNKIEFGTLKDLETYLLPNYTKNKNVLKFTAEQGLVAEELFLTNGFKTTISQQLSAKVYKYFSDSLKPICNSQYFSSQFNSRQKDKANTLMNLAVSRLGINSNSLAFVKQQNDAFDKLVSVFEDKHLLIPAKFIESFGTLRFVDLFPVLAGIFSHGGVLLIDEFDTSLHPMVVMNIINIFHDDTINKNHAQLIFNTQNPIFLNNNLFRRDEIKFVERSDENNFSELYSLSDFGTKGTNARKGKDYMNNYFMSKYGAIRDIDLSDVFEKIVETSNDSETPNQ
ncbi:MAG: ATP-binding protein [Treponema sp.]|nr:ATP-binding protein [Treponema sp.]